MNRRVIPFINEPVDGIVVLIAWTNSVCEDLYADLKGESAPLTKLSLLKALIKTVIYKALTITLRYALATCHKLC